MPGRTRARTGEESVVVLLEVNPRTLDDLLREGPLRVAQRWPNA